MKLTREMTIRCKGHSCLKILTVPIGTRVTDSEWSRTDHFGIYTGLYCTECYENNYPFRKDNYEEDAIANGECIEAID